jgi:maltose alpha-D-glucosyltransferase/alpha-amylase
MDALASYYDRLLTDTADPAGPPPITGSLVARARAAPTDQVIDWIGPYLDRVRLLGLRTAELHLALASDPDDPLFAPQPLDVMHQQSMYGSVSGRLARTFERLRRRLAGLPPEQRTLAEAVLAREADLDRQLARIAARRIDGLRLRIHADYHLAQVLWSGEDYVVIDFEGEPGRPPAQRRFKRTPMRDVAGMVRSFHYASAAALRDGRLRVDDASRLQAWAPPWAHWVSASFLGGYLDRAGGTALVPRRDDNLELLFEFCVLEQCVRELGRDLDHRPEWLEVPLRGLLAQVGGGA